MPGESSICSMASGDARKAADAHHHDFGVPVACQRNVTDFTDVFPPILQADNLRADDGGFVEWMVDP